MKKNQNDKPADDEMRPEYDLRGGVRGKYYERYRAGTNVVLLEPDVARVFRDSATVNEALRRYLSEHGTPPAVSEKAG
jgi:hypothetical protein